MVVRTRIGMTRRAIGALFVAACASSAPPPSHPHPSSVPAPPAPVAPALDARLEAKLAARERLFDWRSTVWGSRAPNPVVPGRDRRLAARFPTSGVASIRAYHVQSGSPGGMPFTADGRLERSVVLPEVTLSDDDRDRIVGMVHAAVERRSPRVSRMTKRAVTRCEFDPHHVLVFFDLEGRPLGKLVICMSCHEVLSFPHLSAFHDRPGEPAALESADLAAIREVLGHHPELGAWAYEDDDELTAYELRTYGPAEAPTELGRQREAARRARSSTVLPEETPANDAERERFCHWVATEARARNRTTHAVGGFECASGRAYSFLDEGSGCERLCKTTFMRMEACLRSSFLDGPDRICASGPAPECAGLLGCLPWVTWRN